MSVLIKGMEMPKSCQGCGLLQEFDECYWCACNSYLVFGDIENVTDYVMNGCPLVEIPTPHPDVPDINVGDMISRQALRDAMYHEAFETDSEMQRWDSGCWIRYKLFENVIENLPSAEPEIIRCKDCKYYLDSKEKCELIDTRLHFYETNKTWDEGCFCSWAERRSHER